MKSGFTITPALVDQRMLKGWTQFDLAQRLEVDPSYVSTLESGRRFGPRMATRLARAFGISIKAAVERGLFTFIETSAEGEDNAEPNRAKRSRSKA